MPLNQINSTDEEDQEDDNSMESDGSKLLTRSKTIKKKGVVNSKSPMLLAS